MIDINRIKIDDIDEYGGVYTEEGYEFLSNREITYLRELYKTNKIAPRSLVVPIDEKKLTSSNHSNTQSNQKNENRRKLTLDKNDKVRSFKESSDIRSIVRQGKVFFIAGAVVFVSLFAQSIILNGIGAYHSDSPSNETSIVEPIKPEKIIVSENDITSPNDLMPGFSTVSSNLKTVENTIFSPKNLLYVEPSASSKNNYVQNDNSGLVLPSYDYFATQSSSIEVKTSEEPVSEDVDILALEKELIKKYCEVYSVNYDIVYNKISELTDNFTSTDYLSGTIPGVTCKGVQVQSDDKEKLLLLTVRNMKQKPEDFSFTSVQINVPVKNPRLGVENATSKEVIVDEYHEKIAHYANIFNLDKCMIHGIVQCETGYDSKRFVENHNPAGLCMDGSFRNFDSDEEGLIELCTELDKYRSKGCTTIAEIGTIHCPGYDYQAWVDLTTECTEYARSKEDEMFPSQTIAYTR